MSEPALLSATRTSSSSPAPSVSNIAAISTQLPPPPPPPPLPPSQPPQAIIENQQTQALIRRILRPQSSPSTPLEDILPALTSSPQVDLQLYAFLAYICRDFIFAWYSKITNDRSFVDEVITVIAFATRSLEERLRLVDLEILLLDEIPSLLDNHVRDYRHCVARHKTSLCPHLTLEESFHNVQPHPALSSSPDSEKLYLKLLASSLLAVLLPTEDLQSNCERTLIREILSGMVLGNVVDKLSEPWMLYDIITKVLGPQPSPTTQTPATSTTAPTPVPSFPSTPTTPLGDPLDASHTDVFYSGEEDFAKKEAMIRKRRKSRKDSRASPLLYPQAREKPPSHHRRRSHQLPRPTPPPPPPPEPTTPPMHPIMQHLDSTISLIFLLTCYAASAISTILMFIKTPHPVPRRTKPILRMALFRFITTLTNIDKRQPWLTGNIALALSPLTRRPAGSLVDAFISDMFQKTIVSQSLVINVLSSARAAMFPNGAMGPARPYPTAGEQRGMREAAKKTLLERIPEVVWRHYAGPKEEGRREVMVEEWLDLLGSKTVNKHLVIQVVELVVKRLVPEVLEEREGGVVEGLLGEKGVKAG